MSKFIFYLIENTAFLNLSAAQPSSQAVLLSILCEVRSGPKEKISQIGATLR